MPLEAFADLTLFITGPTWIRPEVREAGLLPEFGHRDVENPKRFGPIRRHLKTLAGLAPDCDDYEVVLMGGSGSTALEASLRSVAGPEDTVLNVSMGAFGDLYHTLAEVNGLRAVQAKVEFGQCVTPEFLRAALAQHAPTVVTLTHNETSTGVTNHIETLCDIVREAGAVPLVDGVSIFGGATIDLGAARPAVYSTAPQKALALPCGFGIAFVLRELLPRMEAVPNRGYGTDLTRHMAKAAKDQTLSTPNTTLANQMAVQLDHIVHEEGVAARFARHLGLREMAHDWVDLQDGFALFAPEGHRSPTLTCVRAPEWLDVKGLKAMKESMRERGYLFDPGYGKLNLALAEAGRPAVFRMGHMGDVTPDMFADYLEALGRCVAAARP